jgi:hypothetical protein
MTVAAGQPGTVYLLHFDKPYKHARHYTSSGPTTWPRGSPATHAVTAPGSWRSLTRRASAGSSPARGRARAPASARSSGRAARAVTARCAARA